MFRGRVLGGRGAAGPAAQERRAACACDAKRPARALLAFPKQLLSRSGFGGAVREDLPRFASGSRCLGSMILEAATTPLSVPQAPSHLNVRV